MSLSAYRASYALAYSLPNTPLTRGRGEALRRRFRFAPLEAPAPTAGRIRVATDTRQPGAVRRRTIHGRATPAVRACRGRTDELRPPPTPTWRSRCERRFPN